MADGRPPDVPPPSHPYFNLREYGLSDFDAGSADVPIWGWLTGAEGRKAAAQARREQERARLAWDWLMGQAPGVDQLSPEYVGESMGDELGALMGGPSEIARARMDPGVQRALQEMALGRLSRSDQEGMRLATQEQQRLLRGQNEATAQQMAARGLSGSGVELAQRLGTGEAATGALSQMQSQALASLGQRQLGAIGGVQQGYGQDLQRRSAIDAFNQANLDWRRGRGSRNTEWENRTREARANAFQQAQQNREHAVAGLTGQYGANASGERQDAARQAQTSSSLTGTVGEILKGLVGK
jgi:hypothetical protein